ncbi:hypothetical protein [Lactococcus cremoris]|uniref:hypothetical protein n=1 Tax=Lactococcus lactis subsp. cremoris TaxID=1359 RepID=UPI00223BCF59|nr:hypothetical protein [Lactococcus cremoris]MCT0509723.1 hypothetical protein [Lactococcus cremoris]
MTDKNKQESTEELYDRVGKEISSLREQGMVQTEKASKRLYKARSLVNEGIDLVGRYNYTVLDNTDYHKAYRELLTELNTLFSKELADEFLISAREIGSFYGRHTKNKNIIRFTSGLLLSSSRPTKPR